MTLKPLYDYVVCKQTIDKMSDMTAGKFSYRAEMLPEYKVISIGDCVCNVDVGDFVVVNSTGTNVKIDNDTLYLFKSENIVGKIQNKDNQNE